MLDNARSLSTVAQVEQARELFFREGRDPADWLRPQIARSWARCRSRSAIQDEVAPLGLTHLSDRLEQAMRLRECSRPELDALAEHASGTGCVVILSDADGLILDEVGSAEFLPKAQRVALAPGVEWSEASRGTNAIGTALLDREAVLVLGGEHFLHQNGALGCAAAPIFTGRGEVAGVLDISGEAVHVDSHALSLVAMAAQQVEHRMMIAEAHGHVLRFHRRPGLLGTAREGLLVVEDGQIVCANRAAAQLLGVTVGSMLDQPIERLLGMQWTRLERHNGLLSLPGGLQIAATMERTDSEAGRRWPTQVRSHAAPLLTAGPHADTGEVDAMAALLSRAVRVQNEGVPVLIHGETGSGKEVFARQLHAQGRRRDGPFVAINCAALPETLIEAELFGYVEGAFTGARRRGAMGRIREADHGVLFLDEIGDMPLSLQARLLRVLEDRVVQPLGGGTGVGVDFDLVCATHCDLQVMSAQGRFRSDLYYRLGGFRVDVPALRERRDRRHLIQQMFQSLGGQRKGLLLGPAALDVLDHYPWPGNVRELRSVLQSVTALADPGQEVTARMLPAQLSAVASVAADQVAAVTAPAPADDAAPARPATDDTVISQALADCDGNVAAAARRLGVHRSTIYRHLGRR